ncbi:MAG: hypothetical protein AAB442_02310 [Patescibacteria group bacterium]
MKILGVGYSAILYREYDSSRRALDGWWHGWHCAQMCWAERCSLFTPVPGGLGPLAVAKLFENAVTLAENATKG